MSQANRARPPSGNKAVPATTSQAPEPTALEQLAVGVGVNGKPLTAKDRKLLQKRVEQEQKESALKVDEARRLSGRPVSSNAQKSAVSDLLSAALRLWPGNAEAHLLQGQLYAEAKLYEKAVESYCMSIQELLTIRQDRRKAIEVADQEAAAAAAAAAAVNVSESPGTNEPNNNEPADASSFDSGNAKPEAAAMSPKQGNKDVSDVQTAAPENESESPDSPSTGKNAQVPFEGPKQPEVLTHIEIQTLCAAYSGRALVHRMQNNLTLSAQDYTELLRWKPEVDYGYVQRSLTVLAQRTPSMRLPRAALDSVLLDLHKAIQFNKNNFQAHVVLANTLVDHDRIDKALPHYQQALDLNDSYYYAYYRRSCAYLCDVLAQRFRSRLQEQSEFLCPPQPLLQNLYDATLHPSVQLFLQRPGEHASACSVEGDALVLLSKPIRDEAETSNTNLSDFESRALQEICKEEMRQLQQSIENRALQHALDDMRRCISDDVSFHGIEDVGCMDELHFARLALIYSAMNDETNMKAALDKIATCQAYQTSRINELLEENPNAAALHALPGREGLNAEHQDALKKTVEELEPVLRHSMTHRNETEEDTHDLPSPRMGHQIVRSESRTVPSDVPPV